ncbi:hypothetical protein KP509_30G016600 [Ceratopteris richardii]|uniref:Pectinesterase n=1 Tax=Ceratopteris richardii TaxID=49495 RepID=A0A8T2R1Y8_CERRI|nr:hypothetical protein KP509_30G016500 [Ceratopteris richardii]KAH7289729.1 hypothetical protein KP509_30G016600 [Ceratopteris richardii]
MLKYGKVDPHQQVQYESKRKARRRLCIIAGSSLLLTLVIVCVAVGVVVSRNKHSNNGSDDSPTISAGNSAIQAACNNTAYPDICQETFKGFPESLTDNPLQLVTLGVKIALSMVTEAYNKSVELSRQSILDPQERMALEDCSDLYLSSMEYLNSSVMALSSLDFVSLKKNLQGIVIFLSTASSEHAACYDNFYNITGYSENTALLKQEYVEKVIINAIGLVNMLSKMGSDVTSWTSLLPKIHLRRLLSIDNNDGDAYVTQLIARMERQLLDSGNSSSPNVVVAKDGSGDYTSIKKAIESIPESYSGRYVIYIKTGTYEEGPLNISAHDITLLGDGCNSTIITGSANVAIKNYTTYRSATVGIRKPGFLARKITFRNTAGAAGHQAVALRIAGSAVLENCCFEGYQDTLYALSNVQLYKNCQILGTVDYIFGNALAFFQNCQLIARQPLLGQFNTYTAQARKEDEITGFFFQNCSLTPSQELKSSSYLVSTYLGRPWKATSTTAFLESYMDSHINPEGWASWNQSRPFETTCEYGEYKNTGPGSNITGRVTWKCVNPSLSETQASRRTISEFGVADNFSAIASDITFNVNL